MAIAKKSVQSKIEMSMNRTVHSVQDTVRDYVDHNSRMEMIGDPRHRGISLEGLLGDLLQKALMRKDSAALVDESSASSIAAFRYFEGLWTMPLCMNNNADQKNHERAKGYEVYHDGHVGMNVIRTKVEYVCRAWRVHCRCHDAKRRSKIM